MRYEAIVQDEYLVFLRRYFSRKRRVEKVVSSWRNTD